MNRNPPLRIAYVTTAINYPSHRKRVAAFRSLGVSVHVVAFQQEFPYPTNQPADSLDPSQSTTILGVIRAGRYLARAAQLLAALSRVRSIAAPVDVVYASGFDAALLARLGTLLSRRPPALVYEVHDIRQPMLRANRTGRLLRAIERWLLHKQVLLVVTAPGYIDGYYRARLSANGLEGFVLENKLYEEEIDPSPVPTPRRDPLRIGYFGSLRCVSAWNALTRLADEGQGSIQVEVRGALAEVESFRPTFDRLAALTYGGPYRDPEDIAAMYRRVSMVWTAGFHGKDSYIWARSCRFYAACCYERPIIAQAGTDEGEVVERLGIGCCVDLRDPSGTISTIQAISDADLSHWHRNLLALPRDAYAYTSELRALLDRCSAICELE